MEGLCSNNPSKKCSCRDVCNNLLLGTYRKWKDTQEVFYIENKDEDDYYCKYSCYLDNYWFDRDYILEESEKASIIDIAKYKAECLIYKI